MTIVVTPAETFIGTVTEVIPAGFAVAEHGPLAELDRRGTEQTLTWEKLWEAGQTYTLTYTYKAPDVVPLVASFGPLEAKGKREQSESDWLRGIVSAIL